MPLEESITLLAEQMRGEEPTPETMKLLQAIWPTMGARARLDLLSHLGDPPSREQVERWREDNELHRRLLRQWRWLVSVSEDLPEPWMTAHEHLSSAFGLGDPEARQYRIGVQ